MPSLSHCADQVRRLDRDRFVCALFAPAARREALFALYAFNLEVATIAETVSEPLIGQMRLQWWRDSMDRLYAGDPHHHPVAEALAGAIAAQRPSRGHFDRLLDARAFDLTDEAPDDLDTLEAYVDDTAGALDALGLELLGVDAAVAGEAVRHVSLAWGLTGLLRAVPFHAAARRVYLPLAECRVAGFEPVDIVDRPSTPGLSVVVAAIVERAETHLREARMQRDEMPRAAMPVLLPALLAGRYLARLRRVSFDPFALPQASALPPSALLRLAAGAWTGRY